LLAGEITPQPQDNARATEFKTIRKEEGKIDWTRSAIEIERRVRAFNPWPSAFTFWNGVQLKIIFAQASMKKANGEPGRVVQIGKDVGVVTGDGTLILREIQLAGKRAMNVQEFVRGQKEFVGSLLVG
jgi:methionyl-tRNA formyltransferase